MHTAARLSLAAVQLVECALQFFKLLSRLAELAFCGEALVVGEVFGSFSDEGVEVSRGSGRPAGRRSASRQVRGRWGGAPRGNSCAKEGGHRRLEGRSVRKPILYRE